MEKYIKESIRKELRLNEFGPGKEEKEEKEPKEDKLTDDSSKSEHDKLKNLLKNNEIFNHAEIAKQLWGDKDGTNRSLFRKKLEMMTNDAGDVYMFDDEELSKIGKILRSTSKLITKTVGRRGDN